MSKHLEWIDRWKGWLIFFVVLGHSIGTASHFATGYVKEFLDFVFKVIYCFHMPAFFCLAGFVWRRNGVSFGEFSKKKALRLVVPFLVFSFLSAVIYYFMSGSFRDSLGGVTDNYYRNRGNVPTISGLLLSILHAGGWPINGVFQANSVLWFLPVMFMTSIAYWVVDRFIESGRGQLALIPVLLIVSYVFPARLPWGWTLVPYYLSFVLAGRWLLPRAMEIVEKKPVANLMIGALIFIMFCYLTPERRFCTHSFGLKFAFAVFAFLGTLLSAVMSKYIKISCISFVGIESLGIMLIHKYVIVLLGFKLSVARCMFGSGWGAALMAALFIALIALIVSYWVTRFIESFCPEVFGFVRKGKVCIEGGGDE